jgi:tRNA pseudouridine32 synthase / 23S rRNA pseudouridine746 synthase
MKHTRPSRLYLRKLESPPPTIMEHLVAHFPQVPPSIWRERVAQGLISLSDGTTLREDSPYRYGLTVYYRKAVLAEPDPLEEPRIVYRDAEIIVADKPHGMPVTPAGAHVERSLIVRLQKSTGLDDLSPVHRLDRETGGLLLLTIKQETRAPYHRLFADASIEREYLAVANTESVPDQNHWRLENRIESDEPWYCQHIVEGRPNAITEIELIDSREGLGLFRLIPKSGRKHQLRVHMASIGFPIIGDPFYPKIRKKRVDDPPLQLLANRLAFIDPLSRVPRCFTSTRQLSCFTDSPETPARRIHLECDVQKVHL